FDTEIMKLLDTSSHHYIIPVNCFVERSISRLIDFLFFRKEPQPGQVFVKIIRKLRVGIITPFIKAYTTRQFIRMGVLMLRLVRKYGSKIIFSKLNIFFRSVGTAVIRRLP